MLTQERKNHFDKKCKYLQLFFDIPNCILIINFFLLMDFVSIVAKQLNLNKNTKF